MTIIMQCKTTKYKIMPTQFALQNRRLHKMCYSTDPGPYGWCGTCYDGELKPGAEGYCHTYQGKKGYV